MDGKLLTNLKWYESLNITIELNKNAKTRTVPDDSIDQHVGLKRERNQQLEVSISVKVFKWSITMSCDSSVMKEPRSDAARSDCFRETNCRQNNYCNKSKLN